MDWGKVFSKKTITGQKTDLCCYLCIHLLTRKSSLQAQTEARKIYKHQVFEQTHMPIYIQASDWKDSLSLLARSSINQLGFSTGPVLSNLIQAIHSDRYLQLPLKQMHSHHQDFIICNSAIIILVFVFHIWIY